MSRLSGSTSTYLAQHADNPVDWWPWCDEAFDEARRRDVPVLLSVGYASCHWCHVMARESFSDPAIAAQLNRDFVAIKVDREERPDVDAVYMTATQALTGQGGWPMTVLPDPGRRAVLRRHLLPARADRRHAVVPAAAHRARRGLARRPGAGAHLGRPHRRRRSPSWPRRCPSGRCRRADLDGAAAEILGQLDPVHGGFRGAPKFPPSMVAEFLLRHHERTGRRRRSTRSSLTLERMARGGIYDQLGGGFSRYSVDATWHVPHFEKMLDDNAQLLRVFGHHARLTGSPLSARITRGDRRVPAPRHARPHRRLRRLAGRGHGRRRGADLPVVARGARRGAGPGGRRPRGRAVRAARDRTARAAADPLAAEVLRLPADPDDRGVVRRRAPAAARRARRAAAARQGRPRGAAIERAGHRRRSPTAAPPFGRPDWVAAATAAADHLVEVHRVGDRWVRSSRDGRVGPGPAVLADHGDLAGGLLALFQATGDARWLAGGRPASSTPRSSSSRTIRRAASPTPPPTRRRPDPAAAGSDRRRRAVRAWRRSPTRCSASRR